ncbi:TetR/AcrR family transcriptional regulator [Candidatus Soleaferrea massiliensis]|uniref:TetR/AcrR family transcriptional regulator n=1 Tax=Candidatus Soleaferrea massiliensis TaxID=1470354 RepID=UPI00058D5D3A|nr:TetR/AcrR family transcriptional regulator [Candidatus Soleaferrea massiliensis]
MPVRNTKERILEEALTLFSKRGYDGVSVREIAGRVGIRESAIYKHFSGKQGIFDALLQRMQENYDQATKRMFMPSGDTAQMVEDYGSIGLETLSRIGELTFLYWLKDDYAARFRRMVTIEQFHSSEAGKTYRRFFIEEVLRFQSGLFAGMMERGYFHQNDPQLLAVEFYAPFFLLFHDCEGHPEKEAEALELLRKHMAMFAQQHQVAPKT